MTGANMSFIKWDKSLEVGIKEIDDQHKTFISYLNEAADFASPSKPNVKKLGELIPKILDYSRYHFETEEKYFRRYDYPYAEEHMEDHAKLIQSSAGFYDRFNSGEDVAKDLLIFLKDWLETHLKTHDMKYSRFFKKIGVNEY